MNGVYVFIGKIISIVVELGSIVGLCSFVFIDWMGSLSLKLEVQVYDKELVNIIKKEKEKEVMKFIF